VFELFNPIISKISVFHLNILLLLGLAISGGTIGGRMFQRLRIPQVVGYISIGIILGTSGFKIIDRNTLVSLEPFNYFALGLIGFMIGRELKKEVFLKHGRQLINVLLFEGVTAFILVSVLITILAGLLLKNWNLACSLGLLLGAISSATAPAATTDVLWEYKTRGPLTRTVLNIVALDDALALFLFAFASSIAIRLIGYAEGSISKAFGQPAYEILGSILLGVFAAKVFIRILKTNSQKEKILAMSMGTILLVLGLSLTLHLDMLLAAMTMGMIVVNYGPHSKERMFEMIEGFAPPIYVIFFVLVGAKLDITKVTIPVFVLASVYLIGRTLGKGIGANIGARISRMPKSVQEYLPFCLFSQAGVAIGLSILAAQVFPSEIGNTIIIIITMTTFIVQLIGPPFVRFAVVKAKEVGLNIREEDLIHQSKVKDVMDTKPPLVYADMKLADILKTFTDSENFYYPVVDRNKRLLGIITIDIIRNIFVYNSMGGLVLAVDVMEPVGMTIEPDSSLAAAKEILEKHNLEYLPVVDREKRMVGFLERQKLNKLISIKIMELARQADALESPGLN